MGRRPVPLLHRQHAMEPDRAQAASQTQGCRGSGPAGDERWRRLETRSPSAQAQSASNEWSAVEETEGDLGGRAAGSAEEIKCTIPPPGWPTFATPSRPSPLRPAPGAEP